MIHPSGNPPDLSCIGLTFSVESMGYYYYTPNNNYVHLHYLDAWILDYELSKAEIELEEPEICDVIMCLAEMGYDEAKKYIRKTKINNLFTHL